MSDLDLSLVRRRFPALAHGPVFLDNGGGSQILEPVLARMRSFLVDSNVQLGASYPASRLAARRLEDAYAGVATLLNAASPDELVFGPSTTVLFRTLAASVGRTLAEGDEIVVTDGDHEANVAPWVALAGKGAVIRRWRVDPETGELDPQALRPLLGPRTRLVAMTHASNILGSINPVSRIAEMVHEHGAWLCVDGVGFAPHRAIDVQALGADFYAFSFYKTFGPHHAVLRGRLELLRTLPGDGFFFVSEDDVPYKFTPGNVNYELTFSLLGVMDYLEELAGVGGRAGVEATFGAIARHEAVLACRLLDFLAAIPGVRIVGQREGDAERRVPIVSFRVAGRRSEDVVTAVDPHGIGIRFGHFYSPRLIEALGLPLDDGVVRVSMAHYNTVAEIDRLIAVLEPLLRS